MVKGTVSVTESQSSSNSLSQVVAHLAGVIGHPDFPAGDRADLRRLKPEEPSSPAFWRVLLNHVPGEFYRDEEAERRWAVIIQAMALMAPEIHAPGRGLGRVLAGQDRGTMEPRLIRLLRSEGTRLEDQVRLMARMLANMAEPVDWTDLARLVLSRGSETRKKIVREIARDFFYHQKKTSDKD